MNDNNKYNIITLCGSIKFKDEFLKLQEKLTLDGNIVLTPNFFNNVKKEEINLKTKKMLDEMHKQKIDMSDEIYVINFGGYIGESTKSEIEYAKTKDKKISYIEDIKEIAIMEEKKEDTKCDHGFNNTLADAIEKIKSEKWKSIFIERLNDKTLSQIGNEMNLSRERINKIVYCRKKIGKLIVENNKRLSKQSVEEKGIQQILRINLKLNYCKIIFLTNTKSKKMT